SINENFGRVYAELTEGGEAELVLENPEEPFEAGLILKVKPAHKKALRLEALSGGERSLASMALIFAIQEYDPSPLDMLNEIDQGMHVAVRDPFEKSVVAAFELALERRLDPWEINLVPFTKLFLDKVKKDGAVNFVTAGKLVFLAWSILKMQSDKVL